MYSLSAVEIEEVNGADFVGAATSCVAVGGAALRVGGYFGPQAAAASALGGCALGIALYFWE